MLYGRGLNSQTSFLFQKLRINSKPISIDHKYRE